MGDGSLLELHEALKSREKRLLRSECDVGAVATSAGSFEHLGTSLGSGVKAGSSNGFGCYDDDNDVTNKTTGQGRHDREQQNRVRDQN